VFYVVNAREDEIGSCHPRIADDGSHTNVNICVIDNLKNIYGVVNFPIHVPVADMYRMCVR
jgi:hypothetical protein